MNIKNSTRMTPVGQRPLSLDDFASLLHSRAKLTLDEAALQKVSTNHAFLTGFSANKLIYGINTGFGPMAQYKVDKKNLLQLQYNLIRSHCSGGGNLLPAHLSRASMIARLNSLMQAHSGVHPDLCALLATLIERNIVPCIYEHGGVGASGDLVQLAHLGLTLI